MEKRAADWEPEEEPRKREPVVPMTNSLEDILKNSVNAQLGLCNAIAELYRIVLNK